MASTTSTSSLGVGTGIDLQSMLTKLMASESTPIVALNSKISTTNSKISLYGTLKSKLDALKTAADTLQYPSRLSAQSATSSDSSVLGASASYTASIGSYTAEVTQLASAQKSFSSAYTAGTTFDPGELKFTFDIGTSSTISLTDQASYTLEEVSSAINKAGIGVTATVVSASDGTQRMILTGDESGAGKGFSLSSTLTASGSQTSLGSFDTTTAGLMRADAQDAKMSLDGIQISSSTNTFSDAVSGLTLTAEKLGTSTVTIANDSSKITAAAQAFVDSYNAVTSLIKNNSNYSSSTTQSFSGENATRNIQNTLNSARTTLPAGLSSSFGSLSELGISIDQNGLLSLDSTKLGAAISTSSTDVIKTLGAYGAALSDAVTSMSGSGGVLSNRMNGLDSAVSRYKDNLSTMENRVAMIEKRYRAQFTALDSLVSSMNTLSDSLTQQIAALTKSSSG